ncbi:FLILHELTA domain containing protein [Rhypophila decipiens]
MPPRPPTQQRITGFLRLPTTRAHFLQRDLHIPRRASHPSISTPSSPTGSGRISRPQKTPKNRISQTRSFRTSTTRRLTDNEPNKLPTTKAEAEPIKIQRSRLDRILSRLPLPLQGYTSRLKSAPLSHVIAFLVLHEITAILPLLGLFGLFHYSSSSSGEKESSSSSWLPIGYILDNYGNYVQDGVQKFERYFTKKGWFGFGDEDSQQTSETSCVVEASSRTSGAEEIQGQEAAEQKQSTHHAQVVIRKWEDRTSDPKYRILVEIALAYALTKALLPVRIVASVSATPWFAGVLGRLKTFVSKRKP